MLSGSSPMFPLHVTHNMDLINGGFRRNYVSRRMTPTLRLDSESGPSEIGPVTIVGEYFSLGRLLAS